MRISRAALLLCTLAAPAVLFAAPAGNEAAGKEVYTKRCVACHGPNGEGNDKLAQVMNAVIPPLASKDVQALSDDDLKKGIVEGKGKMKPVKELSAADVANVISFVRSLAKK
jgi:mono/diheme cytochrome c family protein